MEDRKKRLEALKKLAEMNYKSEGRSPASSVDDDMMDDILAKKKARIREIFKKQESGEHLKEKLDVKHKSDKMFFEGMSDEEKEEWAAEQKRKAREKAGL